MLTNFDHDRQWFNTLIPLSHESAAVTVDCISPLSEREVYQHVIPHQTSIVVIGGTSAMVE